MKNQILENNANHSQLTEVPNYLVNVRRRIQTYNKYLNQTYYFQIYNILLSLVNFGVNIR